jgi:hypothetical protein
VKSVRKTRASQVAYSEKLLRLQQELGSALELAHNLLQRELVKKDVAEAAHAVWDQRSSLIDIRRKIPSLSPREDEEMFFDKEIVIRKPVRPDAPSMCVFCSRALFLNLIIFVVACLRSLALVMPSSLRQKRLYGLASASCRSLRRLRTRWPK